MSGPRAWGNCETCGTLITGERRFCGIHLAQRMDSYRQARPNRSRPHRITCQRCGIHGPATNPALCPDCEDAA